jgi:outer membrane protein assembly factor BamB
LFDANLYTCAVATGIDASPLETAVGTSISLVGHATGADPTRLTYAWSAPTGTFSAPTSAATDFTCAVPGPVTLTLTVADGPVPDGGGCNASTATVVVTCGGGDAAGCPPTSPTGSTAVAYQIDPTHDGAQPTDSLAALCRRWAWTPAAGAGLSYALVAGGRVFLTYAVSGSQFLVALDEHTGAELWGPTPLGGPYGRVNATYEGGVVFTVDSGGVAEAFDEATGNLKWSTQLLGQSFFTSPPTARGGVLYTAGAESGGTLYAVDETSGAVLWSVPVMNGDQSSPAVTASTVFVSYACNQTYAFSLSGTLVWHHNGPCEGGGGKTVAVLGDNVYTRDLLGNLILDSVTGNQVGNFVATPIPAASGSTRYFVSGGQLDAIPLAQATPTWTFAGDGSLASAPIVVGASAVVGSSNGNLYLLEASTGSIISTDLLPAAVAVPDEQNVGSPLTGLAAADGMLFVPAGETLYAY